MRRCIGIDPDTNGYVCRELNGKYDSLKYYSISNEGIKDLIEWINEQDDTIIAIEGLNGMSKPIEDALRKQSIIFYSFKPASVEYYRRATLGINKTNRIDAEGVGGLALLLYAQGKLDQYRRVWFQDEGLVLMTREYGRLTSMHTRMINAFWKKIKGVSKELYLFLGGKSPEVGVRENILKQKSTLELLKNCENIEFWKTLSATQMLELIGGRRTKGIEKRLEAFKVISEKVGALKSWQKFILKSSAEELLQTQNTLKSLIAEIESYAKDHPMVKLLCEIKGIGVISAATIVAEIIDIRRFGKNNHLASYAGLVQHEASTGDERHFYSSEKCNPRLKNVFITMAKNIVIHDPLSGLGRYHKSLVKRGMKVMEAYKRAARALVRRVYRMWMNLVINLYQDVETQDMAKEKIMGSMATVTKDHNNVLNRHTSNILPVEKISQDKKNVTLEKNLTFSG